MGVAKGKDWIYGDDDVFCSTRSVVWRRACVSSLCGKDLRPRSTFRLGDVDLDKQKPTCTYASVDQVRNYKTQRRKQCHACARYRLGMAGEQRLSYRLIIKLIRWESASFHEGTHKI